MTVSTFTRIEAIPPRRRDVAAILLGRFEPKFRLARCHAFDPASDTAPEPQVGDVVTSRYAIGDVDVSLRNGSVESDALQKP